MGKRTSSNGSIQKLLTSCFLLISLVLLVVVTVLISLVQYRYSRSDTIGSLRQTCVSVANSVDQQINQMNQISLNAISTADLDETLTSYLSGNITAYQHTQYRQHLNGLLTGIKGFDFSIRQLNIYTTANRRPSQVQAAADGDGSLPVFGYGLGEYNGDLTVSVKEEPWYEDAVNAGGRMVIALPDVSEIDAADNQQSPTDGIHISVCRMFYNHLHIPVGFVEVMKYYDTVFRLASSPAFSGQTSIVVYDADGRQLFPLTSSDAGSGTANSIFDYYSVFSDEDEPHSVLNTRTGKKEYVCFSVSEENALVIAAATPQSYVTRQIYRSMLWILAVFLVLFLILLLVSPIISNRISMPIRKIYHFLSDENKDQFELLDLKPTGIREIDKLTASINENIRSTKAATDTLITLKEQEVQAQMLALQSQMNPHFLYNSLSTIGEMAEEGLTEPVAEMCREITEIMRYISSNREQRSPLQEELEICSMYIDCIRMRYGDQLQSRITVPDEMLDLMIPKLCIQLLVENAIRSVTTAAPPWHVDVLCEIRGSQWYITVKDNGPGFDPDVEADLRAKMAQILEKGVLPSLKIQGMGLLNIFIRLYLLDKNQFIFDIGNAPEGGAFVTIGGMLHSPSEEPASAQL